MRAPVVGGAGRRRGHLPTPRQQHVGHHDQHGGAATNPQQKKQKTNKPQKSVGAAARLRMSVWFFCASGSWCMFPWVLVWSGPVWCGHRSWSGGAQPATCSGTAGRGLFAVGTLALLQLLPPRPHGRAAHQGAVLLDTTVWSKVKANVKGLVACMCIIPTLCVHCIGLRVGARASARDTWSPHAQSVRSWHVVVQSSTFMACRRLAAGLSPCRCCSAAAALSSV